MCMNRFKWMLAYIALALTALTGPLLAQSIDEVSISRGYPLAAGDVLRIDFLVRPEIGRDVPVELNGYASFPFIDPVLVSGRTIAELRAELPVLMSGAVIREPWSVTSTKWSLSPTMVLPFRSNLIVLSLYQAL